MVGDVLKGLGVGGQGGAPAPAGLPERSRYQPPLHGDNPHGQGTAGSVDFFPSDTRPLGGDTSSSTDGEEGEDIVLGRSRGEQNADGSYHGKVTILSLFGTDVVPGVETGPGETESGALGPFEDLLEMICDESGGDLCLAVLSAKSETTNSGSENSFNFLNLNVGGEGGAQVSVLGSNGNIEEDSSCQRAHGDSSVARVQAGEETNSIIVGESSTDSEACNNGPSSQENDSSFFTLGGNEFPEECASGEEFEDGIPFFLTVICNADDTNGVGEEFVQTEEPYGVREALTVMLLDFGDVITLLLPTEPTVTLKVTGAASESHAVAPPAAQTPPPRTPGSGTVAGVVGQPGAGPGGQDGEEGPGPVSREAGPGTGDLAFTGSDVLILALIGAALVMAGLTASRLAVRHRRPTA